VIRLGRGTSLLSYRSCIQIQPTSWLELILHLFGVGTSHGQLGFIWLPRPGLGGSHHLPPYSIICDFPPHLHPNGSFSRDSQSGVSKLSQFWLPGLQTFITSRLKLGSGRGLNQSCSSRRELSNSVSHFTCTHRNRVDSRLLVVRSQIASLTPGLSFDHNLCCRCPNGSCEAICGHVHFKTFPRVPRTPQCEMFWPLKSRSEFLGVPKDYQVPFSRVWVTTSQLPQSGVATYWAQNATLVIAHDGPSRQLWQFGCNQFNYAFNYNTIIIIVIWFAFNMWHHNVQCQWNLNPNTRIRGDSTTYMWPIVIVQSSIGCNYASVVTYVIQTYPISPIGCTPYGIAWFMYIWTLTLIGLSTTNIVVHVAIWWPCDGYSFATMFM
jgi:hypothetical protein